MRAGYYGEKQQGGERRAGAAGGEANVAKEKHRFWLVVRGFEACVEGCGLGFKGEGYGSRLKTE